MRSARRGSAVQSPYGLLTGGPPAANRPRFGDAPMVTQISQEGGDFYPGTGGWGYYYRHVVSKETFSDIAHAIWCMTWNWAKRRHPQKGRKWLKDRYYAHRDGRDWVFTDGSITLFRMSSIPIRRHVKIRGDANPYDPQQADYFVERRGRQRERRPVPAPAWLVT